MQSVLALLLRQVALAAALLLSLATPAAAVDLFTQHQVDVQFATPDGKPMADAEVRVFAPGQSSQPAATGRTDSHGKFEFPADKDGFWTAEARTGGEVARVMIRVGETEQQTQPISPYWLYGGLLLLLVLAFSFRIARARSRRPQR
jgi:hypothetical protein